MLGSDIAAYATAWRGFWVCYDKSLESEYTNQAFRDETIFTSRAKLLVRQVLGRERIIITLDTERYYADQSLYVLNLKQEGFPVKFALGILASRLMGFYFSRTASDRKKTFPKIKGVQIEALPLPANRTPANENRFVALVDKMLTLAPALLAAKADAERHALENAAAKTDRDIDQLVYQLYGLTPAEIALVEGTAAAPAREAD